MIESKAKKVSNFDTKSLYKYPVSFIDKQYITNSKLINRSST